MCAALHHQYFVCGAALLGATHRTALCVPLLHCTCGQWAVGSGTSATHYHTAWRLWAVQLLLCTASLPVGSGQWSSCNAPLDCLRAVGSATLAIHCLTARGQWAVEIVQCTVTPPGDGGQWKSCNAPAHKLGGQGVLPRRRSLP